MQWLIDIVKEWIEAQGYALESWVQAQGYLTTGFVNRGDAAGYDFTLATLTADGVLHDLDLSGIIPAGTKAVLLQYSIRADDTDVNVNLKTKGFVNFYNATLLSTQTANVVMSGTVVIMPDENRKCSYWIEAGTFDLVALTVGGWWL